MMVGSLGPLKAPSKSVCQMPMHMHRNNTTLHLPTLHQRGPTCACNCKTKDGSGILHAAFWSFALCGVREDTGHSSRQAFTQRKRGEHCDICLAFRAPVGL